MKIFFQIVTVALNLWMKELMEDLGSAYLISELDINYINIKALGKREKKIY